MATCKKAGGQGLCLPTTRLAEVAPAVFFPPAVAGLVTALPVLSLVVVAVEPETGNDSWAGSWSLEVGSPTPAPAPVAAVGEGTATGTGAGALR